MKRKGKILTTTIGALIRLLVLAQPSQAVNASPSAARPAVEEANETWYSYDSNGNIVLLTDARSASVASYQYDAFGKTIAATGSAAESNPYSFSSKPVEEISSLAYYVYRFYSPELGRWPSMDPSMEAGGGNLFGMVSNDAVNGSDRLGLELWTHSSNIQVIPSAFVQLKCPGDCAKANQKFKVVGYRLFLEGFDRIDYRDQFQGCFGLRYSNDDGSFSYDWWGCWTGVYLFNDANIGGPLTSIANTATCENVEAEKAQMRAHIESVSAQFPPIHEQSY